MITLRADNRSLTKNSKSSYLADNYVSGVTQLSVINANSFEMDDYVVLGEFGSETTEIVQIANVPSISASPSISLSPSSSASPSPSIEPQPEVDNNILTLSSPTKFAHPQDTKATIIRYNQVMFFRTTTAVAPTDTVTYNITPFIDIQADDFYTVYEDVVNTTGFGWFIFYNSTTLKATVASNAIPYVGFEEGSIKKLFDAFFSLLNNKELRLISNDDAFRWANEAYTIARNELNLVNTDYGVPAEYVFTTVAGQQEYPLPSDFSNLVSVTNASGVDVTFTDLRNVRNNNQQSYISAGKYYLRAGFIGFTPVPTDTGTAFYVYYDTKAPVLTSYYDNIELPDNNFYPLVDHMLYRASQKVGRPNPDSYEEKFEAGLQRMKVVSLKRNSNRDSWGIDLASNI